MKNVIAILFIVFLAVQLSAQDISLKHSGNNKNNTFYADLVDKVAVLNGGWGMLGGIRAGYNLSESVSIGLAGYGLIPNKLGGTYINQEGKDELHLGYGGAEISYKYDLSDKFYLSGMVMLGAARVDYENLGGHDYFFIAEPGASLNYKLIDWFGLGYSLNYRFASGVKYADFSNDSFSGWSTDLSFRFEF